MSDNDEITNREIFEKIKDEIYKRNLSNSENFDKHILSLSSFGLAISITFISNLIPINEAKFLILLIMSWLFFGCTIVCVILSFIFSQNALKKQLFLARAKYLEKKEYFEENREAKITEKLNLLSGIFFIIAIVTIITFAIINVSLSNANGCLWF